MDYDGKFAVRPDSCAYIISVEFLPPSPCFGKVFVRHLLRLLRMHYICNITPCSCSPSAIPQQHQPTQGTMQSCQVHSGHYLHCTMPAQANVFSISSQTKNLLHLLQVRSNSLSQSIEHGQFLLVSSVKSSSLMALKCYFHLLPIQLSQWVRNYLPNYRTALHIVVKLSYCYMLLLQQGEKPTLSRNYIFSLQKRHAEKLGQKVWKCRVKMHTASQGSPLHPH